MSFLEVPVEHLEMIGPYDHYRVVRVYSNGDTGILVLLNPLNGRYGSMDVTSDGRHLHTNIPVVVVRKVKKVFIKTLKELVDSGWDWDCSLNALRHPSSKHFFAQGMFEHFGQEYKYQGGWTWTPQMLIEKEV